MNAKLLLRLGTLLALSCAGAAVFAAATVRPAQPAPARFVPATIVLEGKVILRASTSDDGQPDADAVWGYLFEGLRFRPTEDFAALELAADAPSLTLGWLTSRENEHLGPAPRIELEVAYGGRDQPPVLVLLRDGETWKVAPESIRGRFSHRWLRRSEAAALDDPRRGE